MLNNAKKLKFGFFWTKIKKFSFYINKKLDFNLYDECITEKKIYSYVFINP